MSNHAFFVFFAMALILMSVLVSVSGRQPLKKDTDDDGIPDDWESEHWLDPYNADDASLDYNYNGLTNLQEYINDYDPWDKDTDGDGLSNYAECFGLFGFFIDPLASDTDEDGLSDLEEICMYVNTGDEAQMKEIYPDRTDRASVREDINSLRKKYPYKLDPTNSDMDGDGLSDGEEISHGTSPNCVDTDHDGLSDGEEVYIYKTDPTKRDTDGDGLLDSEEVWGTYGTVTDPNNADSDGDGVPDGEEKLGFGFAPIAPSMHALTYEDFISSNAYAGEYITVNAKVDRIKRDYEQMDSYLLYLKHLEPVNGVGTRGVARVNSSWHVDRGRQHVDDRFGLILREGDTIIVVGVAGKIHGSNREITVDSGGKLYLVLSQKEARERWARGERWFPSNKYVKIIFDEHKEAFATVTPSSTSPPAQTPLSTPIPNSSPTPASTSPPLPSSTNETNATAASEPEGKGIFGSLIYVAIGFVIVIASNFLYTKFSGKKLEEKKREKEGVGDKSSWVVSGIKKKGGEYEVAVNKEGKGTTTIKLNEKLYKRLIKRKRLVLGKHTILIPQRR